MLEGVDLAFMQRWLVASVVIVGVVRALSLMFNRVLRVPFGRYEETVLSVGCSLFAGIFVRDYSDTAILFSVIIGVRFFNQWDGWRKEQAKALNAQRTREHGEGVSRR